MNSELKNRSIEYARSRSVFYNAHFSYTCKNDLKDNCYGMMCCNIHEVTSRQAIGSFVRMRDYGSEERETEFWKKMLEDRGRCLLVMNRQLPVVDFICRSHEEVDMYSLFYPYEVIARKAGEYDCIIGDEDSLFRLYCQHRELKIPCVILIQVHDTVLGELLRRNWECEVIKVKYVEELGLPLGYGHSEYQIRRDYLAECVNPESLQPVPDGQFGLLRITSLKDSCQPIINYVTDHFTRISRESGNLKLESHDSLEKLRIKNIVYRLPGIKGYRLENNTLTVELTKEDDIFELEYQLRKNRLDHIRTVISRGSV